MKLRIEIQMDNAAFGDTPNDRGAEAIRVLSKVLDCLASDGASVDENIPLFDTNGNKVGSATIEHP